MREKIEIKIRETIPKQEDVLMLQGIPSAREIPSNITVLFDQAIEIFVELTQPVGMIAEIDRKDFGVIYAGEGRNESETPVAEIYKEADNLALFATTVGQGLHDKINRLFVSKDFALGSMLDSVASAGVEKSADVMEAYYLEMIKAAKEISENIAVMRYSPGYCGWHVSGQRKLFEYLMPEEIGITLRPSYLMEPLKSASGVFIAGRPEIHLFSDNYAFCGQCDTRDCRKRMSIVERNLDTSGQRTGQPASIDKHRKE